MAKLPGSEELAVQKHAALDPTFSEIAKWVKAQRVSCATLAIFGDCSWVFMDHNDNEIQGSVEDPNGTPDTRRESFARLVYDLADPVAEARAKVQAVANGGKVTEEAVKAMQLLLKEAKLSFRKAQQ